MKGSDGQSVDGKVLFVGPGMNGGIAAVLDVYRSMFSPFKLVRTQTDGGKIAKGRAALTGYFSAIVRLLSDRNIRIVHIHSASNASFWRKSLIIRLAKATGRKVVLHNHGGGFKDFYKSNPARIKAVLDRCDLVIALSEEWRRFFTGIGCRRVEVVNNVIMPPSPRDVCGDGLFHLVFLGKITQEKGIYDLLDVLKSNRDAFNGRIMLHVGGNGDVEDFKARISDPDLAGMVRYEGWVGGDLKAELFSKMDALILPSYVEGVPICLLEAMSYGKPVITTPVGGIPSIVTDGANGLLVEPGDCAGLSEAIRSLMSSSAEAAAMGSRGREVSKAYEAPVVAERLRALYRSLLSGEQ